MIRIFLLAFFTFQAACAFAQPCDFPLPPSNTCDEAPLLCDLDGYCSNNAAAVNSGTPNAFCGLVENNNWVSFIAGSPTFTLQINVANCAQGGGLQAQIFSTVDCNFFTSVSNCIDGGGEGSFTLTASNLIIGETYYLMTDGKGGDVCDYSFELLNGTTLSPANAQIEPAGFLCENGTLILESVGTSTNANLTFEWSTQDGNILSGAQTPVIEIDSAGTYKIVIEDAGGCTDSTEITVPINPLPQISISTPDTLDCLIDTIVDIFANTVSPSDAFFWTTQTGNILSGQSTNNPVVDLPGFYQVVVTDTLTGCSNTSSVEVFTDVETPVAIANGGGELNCVVPSLTLDGSGSSAGSNFSYSWTTALGNILSGANTLTPTVDAAGIYILQVTSATNSCTQTASTVVTLNDAHPTGAEITLLRPCVGDTDGAINISTVQGGTPPYLFAFNGTAFQSTNNWSSLPPDMYPIAIQDAIGCEWDTVLTISELPQLIVELGDDQTIPLGCEVLLNARVNFLPEDIDSVVWTPFYDCQNCFEQAVLPVENTTYQVKVIDVNGCTANDRVAIFLDKKRNVFIPNAFSPNDDGLNDIFFINTGKDVAEILNFKIFDRWGELVASFENFPPNDLSYGWDGSLNGRKMDTATFTYFAEILFLDGVVEIYSGDVVLVK
ncbi:MAG: gliding motility-associated C-terminal domain-containing protein [Saprospiraceae bacterium]